MRRARSAAGGALTCVLLVVALLACVVVGGCCGGLGSVGDGVVDGGARRGDGCGARGRVASLGCNFGTNQSLADGRWRNDRGVPGSSRATGGGWAGGSMAGGRLVGRGGGGQHDTAIGVHNPAMAPSPFAHGGEGAPPQGGEAAQRLQGGVARFLRVTAGSFE